MSILYECPIDDSEEYESVVFDENATYQDVLYELCLKIDFQRVKPTSKLVCSNSQAGYFSGIYSVINKGSTYIDVMCYTYPSNSATFRIEYMELSTTKSWCVYKYNQINAVSSGYNTSVDATNVKPQAEIGSSEFRFYY